MVTGMNPTRQFSPGQAALSAARGWSGDASILQAQLLCLQHHGPEDLVEPQPVPLRTPQLLSSLWQAGDDCDPCLP